jgi:hypothetical protein
MIFEPDRTSETKAGSQYGVFVQALNDLGNRVFDREASKAVEI